MSSSESQTTSSRWPVIVALVLLAVVVVIFVIAFIESAPVGNESPATLTADSYMDVVTPLLDNGDPARGDMLIDELGCGVCHRVGAANGIAPSFVGIADLAPDRRPPLNAAAYLYESIIHPTAFVLEGYSGAMPQNYAEILTDAEIGDIIAYLMSGESQ